ncbi:molybdopterin molybdenumtransferase MoeA, partial [Dietzia kunjamensis]|nr:molybdopterin molybdenumtransferase MoeA [Dietzia kunjamensis]
VRARLSRNVTSPAGRVQYLRAALAADGDGRPTADPVSGPGSHLVASMARADVLIEIPADVTSLESGAEVDVLPL